MLNLGFLSKKFCFNQRNLLFSKFIRKMSSDDDKTLETLNFDNLALKRLPIDPIEDNYVREVRNACFSRVKQSYFFLLIKLWETLNFIK